MPSGCTVRLRKGPKRFLFEHKWMLEEDFHLIMDNWNQIHNSVDLPTKLSRFSGSLKLGQVLDLLTHLGKLSRFEMSLTGC